MNGEGPQLPIDKSKQKAGDLRQDVKGVQSSPSGGRKTHQEHLLEREREGSDHTK